MPPAWRRARSVAEASTLSERMAAEAATREPGRDSGLAARRRRELAQMLATRCAAAFERGAFELFLFCGPSRTGILPMTLAVSLVHTGTTLSCDEIERTLRDAVSTHTGARLTFEWRSMPAGDVARRLVRKEVTHGQWRSEVEDTLAQFGRTAAPSPASGDLPDVTTAQITFAVRVPQSTETVMLLIFDTFGPSPIGPYLAHADRIVETLEWVES